MLDCQPSRHSFVIKGTGVMIPQVPVISVVMSTYNRGALLRAAIQSIFGQRAPVPSFELIVVENNSTDDTRMAGDSLITQFGPRLRYAIEGHQGVSHGRNAGIANARASLVAFMDDDVRDSREGRVTVAWERTLLGIQLRSYRLALTSALGFIISTIRGREAMALLYESSLRETLGWILARRRGRTLGRGATRVPCPGIAG
jgi:glycosyltransferase involved in cell wall biosynthesis